MDSLTSKIVKTVKEAYKEKAPKDDPPSESITVPTSPSAMGFSHTELHSLDDRGLGMIHHAVISANIKMLERCVRAGDHVLEMRTGDDLYRTPLLLAVAHGNLEVIKCLVALGANLTAVDGDQHGVVDICVLGQNVRVLDFLIELDNKDVKVFESVIKLFNSDDEDEVIAAAKILFALTQGTADGINGNWERVHNAGGVAAIVKVLAPKNVGAVSGPLARVHALRVLLNIISKEAVKSKLQEVGGLPVLAEQMKPPHNEDPTLVQFSAWVLKEVTRVPNVVDAHAEELWAVQVVPQMIRLIPTLNHEPDALTEIIHAVGNFAEVIEGRFQESIGSQPGTFASLIGVLNEAATKQVLLAAATTVSKIMKGNETNQNMFVEEGGVPSVVRLLRVKNREIQVSAVRAIQSLAENNSATQRAVLEEGAAAPLLQLLKKSRGAGTLVATATTLWALAGVNVDDKRTVAELMGVSTLIEFLASMSDKLHLIGAEGLAMLAYGPHGRHNEIGDANGVQPLVRLLRSSKEHIVLAVMETIRNLCVQTAMRPHAKNQNTISSHRGIRLLVNLIIRQSTPKHSPIVQVEAAHALAAVVLGNSANIKQMYDTPGFSMVSIMELLYHEEETVRPLAGAALATFAYNNLQQQKAIAGLGGIQFSYFEPFLESEDEIMRCAAASQLVILAKVIPDEEEATSSAIGLKLIADILQESSSEIVLAFASECIARLVHMRAGIGPALGSINMVDVLADLLLLDADFVRGPAAVALGYLTTIPMLERKLLQRCRADPYIAKAVFHYTKATKISANFLPTWNHYKFIGIPSEPFDRPNLNAKTDLYLKEPSGGAKMTLNFEDEDGTESSPTRLTVGNDESATLAMTGLTSRASRPGSATQGAGILPTGTDD